MADVFISYKRERRAAARHLEQILIRYGYSVWFDLELVRGQDYEAQIERELSAAKAVIVLWCGLSVQSPGVRSEAGRAKKQVKLVPLVIEPCELPLFSTLEQNIDLTAATGSPGDHAFYPMFDDLERLVGRAPQQDYKALRDYEATWRAMGALPLARFPLEPAPLREVILSEAIAASAVIAGPAHDYAFWERQWDKQGGGANLVALRAIAEDAPRYFADQARARIAEIEAEARRYEEREQLAREARQREEQERVERERAEAERNESARVEAVQAPIPGPKRTFGLERRRIVRGSAAVAALAVFVAFGWWGAERWPLRDSTDAKFKDASVKEEAPKAPERLTQQVGKSGDTVSKVTSPEDRSLKAQPPPPIEVQPVPPAKSIDASMKDAAPKAPERPTQKTYKPGDIFKDCDICPELMVIRAGEFTMGSNEYKDEKPPHQVTIRQPFGVGKYAVTFDDWDACADAGGCGGYRPNDLGWGRGKRPVINVSWNDAKAYVGWLSTKTGQNYRLLSEAEWEYAARAGTQTKYPWSDDIGKGHANCSDCGSQWDDKQTAPVGSFPPNPWGLYDMHGNVCQWVEDPYHDRYDGAPADGSVWARAETSFRVLRGGSWNYNPQYLRSAVRSRSQPGYRYDSFGFRVARTLLSTTP
jgi:formylglycine-generating enzyme required for sulfatase activity